MLHACTHATCMHTHEKPIYNRMTDYFYEYGLITAGREQHNNIMYVAV